MTIIRVGTTKKYSEGWESAFAKGKKKATPAPAAPAAKKSTKKASAIKKAPAKAVAAKSTKKKSSAKKGKK